MMVTVPLPSPAVSGANVTLIEQLVLGASTAGQLFVSANSNASAVILMSRITRGAVPVLPNLSTKGSLVVPTSCFPNFSRFGFSDASACTPLPVNSAFGEPPVALLMTVSVAFDGPVRCGRYEIRIVQVALGASVAAQSFVWEKSPLRSNAVTTTGALPTLARTTLNGSLIVPTS